MRATLTTRCARCASRPFLQAYLEGLRQNESLPLVHFDIKIKGWPKGRIQMVLFPHISPRAAENFRWERGVGHRGAVGELRNVLHSGRWHVWLGGCGWVAGKCGCWLSVAEVFNAWRTVSVGQLAGEALLQAAHAQAEEGSYQQ